MSESRLIELNYFDPKSEVRLTACADTIIMDPGAKNTSTITAIRFGGCPEVVRAMPDAIYGGGTLEAQNNGVTQFLNSIPKGCQRQLSHDGVYAAATLMANDDALLDDQPGDEDADAEQLEQQEIQPRKCYIFCPAGDRDSLFRELDSKTAAPLIPEFWDYVLDELMARGDLWQLKVVSLREKLDAYVLELKPQDANVVEVLEDGLRSGAISIPGAAPDQPDGFDGVENVTGYLNTFGTTVAQRIRSQFQPLFDPAAEPLSEEVLAINDTIQRKAGYSLYDAQLAVAEAVKRQLDRKKVALIVAECGPGRLHEGPCRYL